MNARAVEMGVCNHPAWKNHTPYDWIDSYYEPQDFNPAASIAQRLALESPNPVPLGDLALILERRGVNPKCLRTRISEIQSKLPRELRLCNLNYEKRFVLLPETYIRNPYVFPEDIEFMQQIQQEKPRLHQLARWRYEYALVKPNTLSRHADPRSMDLLDLLMRSYPHDAENHIIDDQLYVRPSQRNTILSRLKQVLEGFEEHPVSIFHNHTIIRLEVP